MKILVYGQERKWVSELQRLFRRDQIELCEAASRDIKLAVTDFPVSKMRKGIFAKIPFLVVSREKREEKILEAFEMGAEDYMTAATATMPVTVTGPALAYASKALWD